MSLGGFVYTYMEYFVAVILSIVAAIFIVKMKKPKRKKRNNLSHLRIKLNKHREAVNQASKTILVKGARK
jgi:hypothetical protein